MWGEPPEPVRLVAHAEADPVRGGVVDERLALGDLRAEMIEREGKDGLAHQLADPATLKPTAEP